MNGENALVVFQGSRIRRTWFNEEWWFVAVDIVEALTDSKDPKGTRFFGPLSREIKDLGYNKIASLAAEIY